MPRVYIPNKSGHDYSDAERFGELVFLTEGLLNAFDANILYQTLIEGMTDAEENDFLLIASLNIMNALTSGIMVQRFGKANYLIYKQKRYIERVIDFTNFE